MNYKWMIGLLCTIFLINTIAVPQITKSIFEKYKPRSYFSSMEAAANDYTQSERSWELVTVKGQEGTIYITLTDIVNSIQGHGFQQVSISGYNFYTRKKDGTMQYSVAEVCVMPYLELPELLDNYMSKMNTAPKYKEQVVFGIGEDLAQKCAEKAGIDPEFVHYEHNGKQYTIWYMISPDGLHQLPDGVNAGTAIISKTTSAIIVITLNVAVILIPIAIIFFYLSKKKKMLQYR